MKNKLFAIAILICALGLSSTAAYYSVIGLSMLFVGAKLPVIVMAAFLEASKVITAAALHTYWRKMATALKLYLTTAVVIISIITSMGIYGLLSSGYQITNIQYNLINRDIQFQEIRLQDYEVQRDEGLLELTRIDNDISSLRTALASNIIQYTDEAGNVITTTSAANRRVFEEQLNRALQDRSNVNQSLEVVRDSIRVIGNRILEIEADSDLAAELGPLQYISNIINRPMDNIVNYLMLILIFVFDPLALTLVVTALFAFGQANKPKEIKIEKEKPIEPKKIEEKLIENTPMPKKEKIETPQPKENPKPQPKENPKKMLEDIKPEVKNDKDRPIKKPNNKLLNRVTVPFKTLFDKSFKQHPPKKNKGGDVKIY